MSLTFSERAAAVGERAISEPEKAGFSGDAPVLPPGLFAAALGQDIWGLPTRRQPASAET